MGVVGNDHDAIISGSSHFPHQSEQRLHLPVCVCDQKEHAGKRTGYPSVEWPSVRRTGQIKIGPQDLRALFLGAFSLDRKKMDKKAINRLLLLINRRTKSPRWCFFVCFNYSHVFDIVWFPSKRESMEHKTLSINSLEHDKLLNSFWRISPTVVTNRM